MQKLYTIVLTALMATTLFSCDKWTDMEAKSYEPGPKSAEYYAALRAYKQTDHAISFGWYGGWTAEGGASLYNSLRSLPDSLDIVSIWGGKFNLSQRQIDEKKYIQEVLGTKVIFTLFSHNMANFPGDFENIPENIPAVAKALADSIAKYEYDGIDFDQESSGKDLFHDKTNMTTLLRETRKQLGPDKLILVDGNVGIITEEGWTYADYAVSQAYTTTRPSSLQTRFDAAKANGLNPERFIVTENFESYAANGGVTYTDPVHGKIPSLLGMAYWNPEEGRKGGAGSYHMEYEFLLDSSDPYKYLRQAIQIMNPANPQK